MKKLVSVFLAALLLVTVAACSKGDDAVSSRESSGVSSAGEVITITPSVPASSKDNIAANDPQKNETHTITDTGSEVERTTNQLLEAADFVSSTCALTLAVRDAKLGTEIKTDSLSLEYYCRAVQLKKALNGRVELSKEEFEKTVFDCFGVRSNSIYQMTGITSYANGIYTVEEFNIMSSFGIHFEKAELLGNGYVRYTGTFSYNASGSIENETEYNAVCLVKHTTESSEGFQLISFKVSR